MASEKKSFPYITVLLFVLISEVLIISAFAKYESIVAYGEKERLSISQWLGEKTELQIMSRSDEWYRSLFMDTGIVDSTLSYFLPENGINMKWDAETYRREAELRNTIIERHRVIWSSIYLVLYRISNISNWFILLLPLIVPLVVDGWMKRECRKWEFAFVSPLYRKFGFKLVTIIAIILSIIAVAPVSVPALVIPIGIAVSSFGLWVAIVNTQKYI